MTVESHETRFEHPPVRSVLLTLYFEPVDGLLISHLSTLRETFRSQYPTVEELSPLPPFSLTTDSDADSTIPFMAMPHVRYSAADDSGHIAIQSDRITRTWRFSEPESIYPGFLTLAAELEFALNEFRTAVDKETQGSVNLVAAECSYVNELPNLDHQDSLVGIATQWSGVSGTKPLPSGSYAGLRLSIEDDSEPEHAAMIALDSNTSGATTLEIAASYEYRPDAIEGQSELAGLKVAHDRTLGLFQDFTSQGMQEAWGRNS